MYLKVNVPKQMRISFLASLKKRQEETEEVHYIGGAEVPDGSLYPKGHIPLPPCPCGRQKHHSESSHFPFSCV